MSDKNIEEIYNNIAICILFSLENIQNWSEGTMTASMGEESVSLNTKYKDDTGKYSPFRKKGSPTLAIDFKELQSLMKQGDKITWNKATFVLNPDGTFNMNFEWDQTIIDEAKEAIKEYDPRFDN